MEESGEEKYLGDLITSDGSNKNNVAARKGRGFGIIECLKRFPLVLISLKLLFS